MSTGGAAFGGLLDPLDHAARTALARYPFLVQHGPLVPLGNRGGFSGARLFRVAAPAGPLCLRAWPSQETLPHLAALHRLMATARACGLTFVPAVFPTADGATVVSQAGRLWELAEWLPGQADFHQRPTLARLEAACRSLAALHLAWQTATEPDVCPAVRRRLEHVAEWQTLLRSGWHPLSGLAASDPTRDVVERAWRVVTGRMEAVPRRLQHWASGRWPRQPCLCDVWHDHLLFEGDHLTGLVDYGAVKTDHIAVDLARMLGSLVEDDAERWRLGLTAYRAVRPLSPEEEELAHDLDVTGTVLGVATWLRCLCAEGRAFEDRAAAARRLGVLVGRVERWQA